MLFWGGCIFTMHPYPHKVLYTLKSPEGNQVIAYIEPTFWGAMYYDEKGQYKEEGHYDKRFGPALFVNQSDGTVVKYDFFNSDPKHWEISIKYPNGQVKELKPENYYIPLPSNTSTWPSDLDFNKLKVIYK